jgi:epoxyqueuosine reductase
LVYRKAIGNRVYGCDDCQLVCPWNKYAKVTEEKDFFARQQLHNRSLVDLFKWTESEFLKYTEGSAIRRIGYRKWKRNIAVGLGNQVSQTQQETEEIKTALHNALDFPDEMVQEHIQWALTEVTQHESDQVNIDNVTHNSKYESKIVNSGLDKNTVNRKTLRLARSVEKGMPKHK